MHRFIAPSLLLSLVFTLAACDPEAELDVTATLSPEAFAGYTDALPAQVVLGWDFAEPEDNLVTPDGFYQLGIVCEAPTETAVFAFHYGYIGCSNESSISVWVAPLVVADGEEVACGAFAADEYDFPPEGFTGGDPWAEATANANAGDSACDSSHVETLSLDLLAPG